MARKRYEVVTSATGWKVTHQGLTVSNHSTKDDAVAAGSRVARANQPSQLVIHLANGVIEKEYTYGDDPFPPRG